MAQSDMFLKFSIPTFVGGGATTDTKHSDNISAGRIEIQSFSGNISHTPGARGGTGHEIEAINHDPFTITKFVDGSSPTFMQACCSGAACPNIEIECWGIDGSGDRSKWLTIHLHMAIISGYSPSAGPDNFPPTEVIEITYGGITMNYDFGDRNNMIGGWMVFTQTPTGLGISGV